MLKKLFFLFAFFFLCSSNLIAQRNVNDSAIFMPLISVDYTAMFGAADYADRFGFTNAIGLSADFKTKKNFIYGVHGNFLFGNQVNETSQFEPIVNSDGTVTNIGGATAGIALKMRGFNVNADFGYLFTFKKPNPNSGLFLKLGLGYLQHKIYIQNVEDDVPQFNGDYKKGYDRQSRGFNVTQHIGYMFINNKGIWNFHVGLYIAEGFTQNVRYNFDIKSKNSAIQTDLLFGIKAGWIVPIYKRAATMKKFYN
ncbi:MAG: hypothetical protein R2799_15225 [Crocinitomicaceae bacterium]